MRVSLDNSTHKEAQRLSFKLLASHTQKINRI